MPHPSDGIISIGQTLLTHEIFSKLLWSILHDLFIEGRPASLQDESVGDFISRRFHPNLADNIVSAVLHGIYAGDIYSLSAKSLLPMLWEAEALFGYLGTVIGGLWEMKNKGYHELQTNVNLAAELQRGWHNYDKTNSMSVAKIRLASDIKNSSVFTLRGGLGQLSDELVTVLKRRENVSIRTHCYVQGISQVTDKERTGTKVDVDIFDLSCSS